MFNFLRSNIYVNWLERSNRNPWCMRCKLLWFLWLHDRVGWCAGRVGRLAVIAVELMVRTAAQAGWQAYTLGVEQAVA